MRGLLVAALCAGCSSEASLGANLQYATLRVPYQTSPEAIAVYTTDIDMPYDVLGDVEVTLRQRSAFGEMPTKDKAVRELQQQAGRIGAHAIIMLSFGELGMSWWSYNELKGHGRAVRFR
jgi:hypothetical protein